MLFDTGTNFDVMAVNNDFHTFPNKRDG